MTTTSTPYIPIGYWVEVTGTAADTVNVRSEPDITSAKLGTIRTGDRLQVTRVVDGAVFNGLSQWLMITFAGGVAYVHNSLIEWKLLDQVEIPMRTIAVPQEQAMLLANVLRLMADNIAPASETPPEQPQTPNLGASGTLFEALGLNAPDRATIDWREDLFSWHATSNATLLEYLWMQDAEPTDHLSSEWGPYPKIRAVTWHDGKPLYWFIHKHGDRDGVFLSGTFAEGDDGNPHWKRGAWLFDSLVIDDLVALVKEVQRVDNGTSTDDEPEPEPPDDTTVPVETKIIPFGVHVDLWNNPPPPEQLIKFCKVVRVPFHFARMEYVEGGNFLDAVAKYMAYVKVLRDAGITVIGILYHGTLGEYLKQLSNPKYTYDLGNMVSNGQYNEYLPRFIDYCRNVVQAFSGLGMVWEIWNEPDQPGNPKAIYIPAGAYGQMVGRMVRMIRENDSSATVISGGQVLPLVGSIAYYKQWSAVARGAGGLPDGVGVHTYTHGDPAQGYNSIEGYFNAWPEDVVLWDTETGISGGDLAEYIDGVGRGTLAAKRDIKSVVIFPAVTGMDGHIGPLDANHVEDAGAVAVLKRLNGIS